MLSRKTKLWVFINILGWVGVASLLFSDIPLDNLPPEIIEKIPKQTLRWILLINPALIVLVMTTVGIATYPSVFLKLPLIEFPMTGIRVLKNQLKDILLNGIGYGIVAGIILFSITKICSPYLPSALLDATKGPDLNILTRILYGGITEEIMTRFGLMSLFIWIISKLSKSHSNYIYWVAIFLSSLLFALGHFPIMFQIVKHPTVITYSYIILGNSVGGWIFGYLYWKKGLESAMIAHAVTHITMMAIHTLGV